MKKLALLVLAFFTASLPSLSVMADTSPAASGPRPGTVEAMRCLVRQGPRQCEHMFQGGARYTAKTWVFPDQDRDFERGALVSSTFRRRASNANGCDIMAMIGKPT